MIRNTVLSKPMVGFEQALRDTVYCLCSTLITILVFIQNIAIWGYHEA